VDAFHRTRRLLDLITATVFLQHPFYKRIKLHIPSLETLGFLLGTKMVLVTDSPEDSKNKRQRNANPTHTSVGTAVSISGENVTYK
jgi:hypothetical protein